MSVFLPSWSILCEWLPFAICKLEPSGNMKQTVDGPWRVLDFANFSKSIFPNINFSPSLFWQVIENILWSQLLNEQLYTYATGSVDNVGVNNMWQLYTIPSTPTFNYWVTYLFYYYIFFIIMWDYSRQCRRRPWSIQTINCQIKNIGCCTAFYNRQR